VIGVPFSLKALAEGKPDGEDFVIYDDLGAGAGCRIAVSEGGEAAVPFLPARKPIDAYCACILDSVTISKTSPER
jgi:ethanolamine utilization protein EutN